MNETEARDFIAKEVSGLLWKRLAGLAAFFGIANATVLIGLWYSVTSQAELIAKGRASEVAEREALRAVEGASTKLQTITSMAQTQIDSFIASSSKLSERLGSSDTNLARLEESYKVLEGGLRNLERTAKEATESATTQFAEAVAEFAALPDDQKSSIKQGVDVAGKRLQSLNNRVDVIANTIAESERRFEAIAALATAHKFGDPVKLGADREEFLVVGRGRL